MLRTGTARTVGFVTLAALLLRLYGLFDQPLWYDEVNGLARASAATLADLLARLLRDNQAPLYDLLLWVVGRVVPLGDGAARLPPVLFGTALVPVTYGLAVTVFASRRAGLVAAVWVALAPYLVRFGQEGRPYALLALLSGVILLSAVRVLHTGGRRGLVGLALGGTGLVLCHYYGVLLLVAVALTLVLSARSFAARLDRVVWALLVPLAALLAWAPLALRQFQVQRQNLIYEPMHLGGLLAALDAQGLHACIVDHPWLVVLGRVLVAALLAVGLGVAWNRRGVPTNASSDSPSTFVARCTRPAIAVGLSALLVGACAALPLDMLTSVASAIFKQGRALDIDNIAFLRLLQSAAPVLGLLLALLTVALVMLPRWARRPASKPWPQDGLLLGLALVVPPLLVTVLDATGTYTFATRNLILLAPVVATLAGGALARLPARAGLGAGAVLATVVAFGLAGAPRFNVRPPWPAAVRFASAFEAPLLAYPPWLGRCLEYHGNRPWNSVWGTYQPEQAATWAAERDMVVFVRAYESMRDAGDVRSALLRTLSVLEVARFGSITCEVLVRR